MAIGTAILPEQTKLKSKEKENQPSSGNKHVLPKINGHAKIRNQREKVFYDVQEKLTTGQKNGEKPIKFLRDENTSGLYLKEISNSKSLNPQEEAQLAVRIRRGDRKSLNKLIKANLKFVVSVCKNYQNQGLPMADLINEGNLGLIRAAKRFDETKHFKFISYAVWWVRQAILQSLAEHSRIIKLPPNRVGTIHKLGKSVSYMEQKLGRTPTIREISKSLNIKENDINDVMKISNPYMSLDAPIQKGEDS